MKILNKILLILFIMNIVLSVSPRQFILDSEKPLYRGSDIGLADNSIVDLRIGLEKIFVSTSGGLSYVRYNDLENSDESFVEFFHYSDDTSLPNGGNPALTTLILPENDYGNYSGNVMAVVSGIENANSFCGVEGTGISWSLDNGENWHYTEQPNDFEAVENHEVYCTELIEDIHTSFPGEEDYMENIQDGVPDNCYSSISGCSWNGEECEYLFNQDNQNPIPFNWGNNQLFHLPANLTCNITYDLSVDIERGYIYTANFAGLLRRFKFYDFDNSCIVGQDSCSEIQWEIVPLPTDSQTEVTCGGFSNSYIYNAWDEDHYNHRVYSVLVYNDSVNDDIIWVGTGDGINKGYITSDNCINWQHNSENLNGHEWIIDIVPEYDDEFNSNLKRIWLISWLLNEALPPHSLTYTENVGEDDQNLINTTWNQVSYFKDEAQAVTENIFFDNNIIYVSTDKGLFYSNANEDFNWSLHSFPNQVTDIIQLENTTSAVSYLDEYFFIGTPGGLIGYPCVNPENFNGFDCTAFQEFEYSSRSNLQIFPNPFRKGDPYSVQVVKFKYETQEQNGKVDIFDFNMNRVTSFDCNRHPDIDDGLYCFWDGLNDNNHTVANGVYFCRINVGNNSSWEKLLFINYK